MSSLFPETAFFTKEKQERRGSNSLIASRYKKGNNGGTDVYQDRSCPKIVTVNLNCYRFFRIDSDPFAGEIMDFALLRDPPAGSSKVIA